MITCQIYAHRRNLDCVLSTVEELLSGRNLGVRFRYPGMQKMTQLWSFQSLWGQN